MNFKDAEKLAGQQIPHLFQIVKFFAEEDEYEDFDSILSELGRPLSHLGILDAMATDTSVESARKLNWYFKYCCTLGARNGVVMLKESITTNAPQNSGARLFLEKVCRAEHEKAEGIFVATMNRSGTVFRVPEGDIDVQRATRIVISVPNEKSRIYGKFIVLSFIYPGEIEKATPSSLATTEMIYKRFRKIRLGF